MGYSAVKAIVAQATGRFAAARDNRNSPSSENAATASIAVRVTTEA